MEPNKNLKITFDGKEYFTKIMGHSLDIKRGTGEYNIFVDFNFENKDNMTNTQFKIGDTVIMTADSGKGRVWVDFDGINIKDGEYEGKVICGRGEYPIMIELKNGRLGSFNRDGNAPAHPGMSIRLAEDKVAPPPPVEEKNPPSCLRCNQAAHDIDEYPCTSSQWIEGQIPLPAQGGYCVHGGDFKIVEPFWKTSGTVATCRQYTHYMSIDLPPLPPVKQVEAYGFLQRFNEIQDMILKEVEDYERLEDKARAFYSQPATAEVLNKYLGVKNKPDDWADGEPDITLDQFIHWHKKTFSDELLIFTPAALDELGIK